MTGWPALRRRLAVILAAPTVGVLLEIPGWVERRSRAGGIELLLRVPGVGTVVVVPMLSEYPLDDGEIEELAAVARVVIQEGRP